MRRRWFPLFFSFCMFLGAFFPLDPVRAAPNDVIVNEEFISRSMIDEAKTDAVVDTAKGEVRLPKAGAVQSIDSNEHGTLAIRNNQIEFYNYGEGGELIQNPYLSHATTSNAIAAVFTPESLEHFVLTKDGKVRLYRYTESGFMADPAYELSGFASALSIAKSQESLFVLDDRQIRVYKDIGGGLVEVPQLNIDLDIDEPIQVSTVNEDVIVLDGQGNVHYYRFLSYGYNLDPAFTVSGASAIDGTTGHLYTVQESRVVTYSLTESDFVQNDYLSFTHGDTLAVSGTGDVVIVRDKDGISSYYLNGSSMVNVDRISGLRSVGEYLTPRKMQTKSYSLPEPVKRIQVEVDQELPEGTQIELSVSVDGGSSFQAVDESGVVLFAEPVDKLLFRAVLSTADPTKTPILKAIRVRDKSLDVAFLQTTRIVRNPPGNPPLPTELPVKVVGGYNFDMLVHAPGAVEVSVFFSNGESLTMKKEVDEYFTATHHFPADATGAIDVIVRARDDQGNEVEKVFPAHYLIGGNILSQVTIYDLW